MRVPLSMEPELAAWNNNEGISLEAWVECSGTFSLAVGYTTLFWPEFVCFEGYVLRKDFSEDALRGFEAQNANAKSVQWVMNHLHLMDVQHLGCEDISSDKLAFLGETLASIYKIKLASDFPSISCEVEFLSPADVDDVEGYQLSFCRL